MRWWLAAAFAVVAAVTAVAVVTVLETRSVEAFHRYAKDIALGVSVNAAERFKLDTTDAGLREHAVRVSARRSVAVFVFDGNGQLLTAPTSHGVAWSHVPGRRAAALAAVHGERYIQGASDGSSFVIGLQIHGGPGKGLVVFALRPDLRTQLGIVRNEFPTAAIVAFLIAAVTGLAIAVLIGRRLRRIADAAHAIGSGDLSRTVRDRFPDEVGSLAGSIEDMRRQLQVSFTRLEELVDRLNDGVLLVDRELNVRYANGVAASLLDGHERLDSPDTQFLADFVGGIFAGTGLDRVRLSLPDGRRLLLSAIRPDNPDADAIVVVDDESQQERQERAQREFATNAAHELRTPLASIVTAVEMLQTGAKDDPEVRDEFLDLIGREAGRLTRLARALLVLARVTAQEEEPRASAFVVRPILEQLASELQPAEGVSVMVACDGDLIARGDPILLEQALASLAMNAAQHTREGTITLGASAEDGAVVIRVADTGLGIPRDRQAKLFERFYRAATDTPGFGLGLSIARDAVQALGGTIDVRSEPGAGTDVQIRLPRVPAEVVA